MRSLPKSHSDWFQICVFGIPCDILSSIDENDINGIDLHYALLSVVPGKQVGGAGEVVIPRVCRCKEVSGQRIESHSDIWFCR